MMTLTTLALDLPQTLTLDPSRNSHLRTRRRATRRSGTGRSRRRSRSRRTPGARRTCCTWARRGTRAPRTNRRSSPPKDCATDRTMGDLSGLPLGEVVGGVSATFTKRTVRVAKANVCLKPSIVYQIVLRHDGCVAGKPCTSADPRGTLPWCSRQRVVNQGCAAQHRHRGMHLRWRMASSWASGPRRRVTRCCCAAPMHEPPGMRIRLCEHPDPHLISAILPVQVTYIQPDTAGGLCLLACSLRLRLPSEPGF